MWYWPAAKEPEEQNSAKKAVKDNKKAHKDLAEALEEMTKSLRNGKDTQAG